MTLPPPRQPLRCENADCALPSGGRCARVQAFSDPLAECPSLARLQPGEIANVAPTQAQPVPGADAASDVAEPAPWLGEALSPGEVDELLHRSHPIVLAVLGPPDAGKTCLITAFFLQLANGQRADFPYRFASSRSLYGFYGLAVRANRWMGGSDEAIVDRTPKTGDECRFLHLGVRPLDDRDDRHIDVLISDMPGEWVSEWVTHQDETNRRRLAFFDRADGVMVIADASQVASNRRYSAEIARLLQRVIDRVCGASAGRKRRLCLVFSKLDRITVPVPTGSEWLKSSWGPVGGAITDRIWAQVNRARDKGLTVDVCGVSAFGRTMAAGQPTGVMAPFTRLVTAADARVTLALEPLPIAANATPFETMRIWRV